MVKNVNRKGQIFLFDLIFSFVILIVSLSVFLIYYSEPKSNSDIYELNSQILFSLTQTKINSLNSQEVRDMFLNNQIRNIDNTISQQISEFYHTNQSSLAENLATVFISDYLNRQMNFELLLEDSINQTTIFSQINNDVSFEESEISSVSRRIVFGFINRSNSYGPHEYTIRIWQ